MSEKTFGYIAGTSLAEEFRARSADGQLSRAKVSTA